MSNVIVDGIMGVAIADALGVPVEFNSRDVLLKNPVTGMRSHGTYNQPAGTWSDDTSMTLALVDSLIKGLDYQDIMDNFTKWFEKGEYTPHGEPFDIGNTTREALLRYSQGMAPLDCGGKDEHDNGNGSLMRILPIVFYLESLYGRDFGDREEVFDRVHNISSLTHKHKRSLMACGIYIFVAAYLLAGENVGMAIELGVYDAMKHYRKQDDFQSEFKHFARIEDKNFKNLPLEEIKSSGYVVDTLEAAFWCLLNTNNYQSCVLKAVNLGDDTDTVAAVVGGLAGIAYGSKNIPMEWKETLVNRKYIENLSNKLYISLRSRSAEKILKYIPYFETATKESVSKYGGGEKIEENTYSFAYPIYDDQLLAFINEVYESNLMHSDYLSVIDSRVSDRDRMDEAIATADPELLRAILTRYIRQERFSEGLWARAVEDKIFLRILKRLKELLKA